jgi:hypothetical protein
MSDKQMTDKIDRYFNILRSHQIDDLNKIIKMVKPMYISLGIIIGLLIWLFIIAIVIYVKVGGQ